MKFVKYTRHQPEAKMQLTFFSPVEHSNIMRYAHVIGESKDEKGEPTTIEYITIEYVVLAEQSFSVPLKHQRRIKQTKEVEEFQVSENIKLMQPIMETIREKAEVDALLTYLESNAI